MDLSRASVVSEPAQRPVASGSAVTAAPLVALFCTASTPKTW